MKELDERQDTGMTLWQLVIQVT